jgi:hypothetical protein
MYSYVKTKNYSLRGLKMRTKTRSLKTIELSPHAKANLSPETLKIAASTGETLEMIAVEFDMLEEPFAAHVQQNKDLIVALKKGEALAKKRLYEGIWERAKKDKDTQEKLARIKGVLPQETAESIQERPLKDLKFKDLQKIYGIIKRSHKRK